MDKFQIRTAIYYGADSLHYLGSFRGQRALVVTDSFMAASEIMKRVLANLDGLEVTVFDRVQPNPTIEVVTDCLRDFIKARPQVVVALGGGSSLDTAKAVFKIAKEQGYSDIEFIAIPTTSGSGSEMTSYSVITNAATKEKLALTSPDMYPDVAILDPHIVLSTPPKLTADSGMDAVSHAVEAYVSTHHTDFSDAMAEKALLLLFEYLPITYQEPHNLQARERVHNAACLAGMAFENAGLGIVHSMSHAIGGQFNVPHGRLNALIMPTVIEFNASDLRVSTSPASPTALRYAHLGRMLDSASVNTRGQALGSAVSTRGQTLSLVSTIKHLRRDLEMGEKITDVGISRHDYMAGISTLADTALRDRCTPGNPREVSRADMELLLRKLL